jgi:nitroreductase
MVPKMIDHFYKKTAPFQYDQGWMGWRGFVKRTMVRLLGYKRPVMRDPNSLMQMRLWAVKSTALAAQNLMLAFQSHGYSTCPMEGFDEKRLRKVLPLPKGAIAIMLLAVGLPGMKAVRHPRLRFPLEQNVSWY